MQYGNSEKISILKRATRNDLEDGNLNDQGTVSGY